MSEWRDIKTAPKDGTKFLAWTVITKVEEFDENDNLVARDLIIQQPVIAQNFLGFGIVEVPFRDIVQNRKFTHWMPLPKPPATGSADHGSTPKDDGANPDNAASEGRG